MTLATPSRPARAPRWPLVLALVLVAVLVGGVLLAASMVRHRPLAPLALAEVPAPAARSDECARLLAALPEELDGAELGALPRRRLRAPAPVGVAGWGDPPVVVRCGLDRPAELTASSRLLAISGVQFLEIHSPGMSTWVAVDRPVYLVAALPPSSGSGPLQQIATVVSRTLPEREVSIPR